ncbi:MAG TPA: AAA family ATPase [Pyrinomonadaceae bacterium]|nr:AAA family ATPase [Pyrinomonadaceae bacterium]
MIHVKRGLAPAALKSASVRARLKEAARFFNTKPDERRQQRFEFYPAILIKGVRESLAATFAQKCAYCESLVVKPTGYDIDSFRPRSRAVNLDGSLSSDHYWWLIYEWSNLLFSCAACNKLKGSRFPIEGTRVAAGITDEATLLDEQPLLLDPCRDYPEEELIFDEKGKVASNTKRGRVTIDVLGLNRSELVKARAEVFKLLRPAWQTLRTYQTKKPAGKELHAYLERLTNPALPFLAMRRQFVNQWSNQAVSSQPTLERTFKNFLSYRTALTRETEKVAPKGRAKAGATKKTGVARRQPKTAATASSRQIKIFMRKTAEDYQAYETVSETFSVTSEKHKESYFTKTRLIERIEIRNFKIIENLTIQIPSESADKGSWLLLLGENGTGKSSILQAIALTLMGKRHRTALKLKASDFVRYGKQSGYIKVYLTGSADPIELHFRKGSRLFSAKPEDPKVLLLAYGATRLLPRGGTTTQTGQALATRQIEAAKAYNLFNPFIPLNDATKWLWQLEDKEFDRIARSLKDLMLLKPKDRLLRNPRNKQKIEVAAFGTMITLEDLSDGYQSVVALTTDIMNVMRLRWPAMEIAEGIVLIDEIDAHLHPSWKMKIVQRLRTVFPRLQFLVTSHDPLTLRGLHAGEVVVMKSDNKSRPVIITDLPSPEGMRVDQLLTSEYFGLNSTIDPAIEEKFEQYYHLLALRKRTKAQEEKLRALKDEMSQLELLGTTRRERMMLEATDEFLAKSSKSQPADGGTVRQETRRKLERMWKKMV